MILTADKIGDKHTYIKEHKPDFQRSMESIKNEGGPWKCRNGCVSYLVYRCSVCGKDLTD